ncbi:uncharacterized protein L3040_007909 [Drepanopeziza brunnea f. sp. 'multigermtubi']|uniref:uncharacterized protein n=1 Tax=Drepanopeziza brunnea f. sp. 'multigermtubi' TaxID=698441 RepID=UPI00238B5107|nr:hypothetical protein L3040_007909 [Drepanopeziza brunnea f. sp. 'multigermtubi']
MPRSKRISKRKATRKGDSRQKGRNSASSTSPANEKLGKFVIGIDMGTTQSAIAIGQLFYPVDGKAQPPCNIRLHSDSAGSYQEGAHRRLYPSTFLYYDEDGTPITGHGLDRVFDNPDPSSYEPARLFRLWKLMFHSHNDDPQILKIQTKIQEQLDGLGKTRDDLIRDWATFILEDLGIVGSKSHSYLRGQYANFDRFDIEVVVAVPPGRTTIAHAEVLRAFIQSPLTCTSVSLESEPAAMFRSWLEGENPEDWEVGRTYLIADGGGGTCCFVRFRLDSLHPLEFTQEFASESVCCGAETVSESMYALLDARHPDCANRTWELNNMRNHFDRTYKNYVGSNKFKVAFKISHLPDEYLRFDSDEVEGCFKRPAESIVLGIQRQCEKGGQVDYLVLGGGLFQNPYVLNIVTKEFPNLTIRETLKDKGLVAKGCVLSRMNTNVTTNCTVGSTKAIETWLVVSPKIRDSDAYQFLFTEVSSFDGKEYILAAEYIVKKGDSTAAVKKLVPEPDVKTSRMRELGLDTPRDLVCCDRVLTFGHQPGKDDTWAALCKDGSWMDQKANQVPGPERTEDIKWHPFLPNPNRQKNDRLLSIKDLDERRPRNGTAHKALQYGLGLQVNEVDTRVGISIFEPSKRKRNSHRKYARQIEPTSIDFFFGPQISLNLAESFRLKPGGGEQNVLNDVTQDTELEEDDDDADMEREGLGPSSGGAAEAVMADRNSPDPGTAWAPINDKRQQRHTGPNLEVGGIDHTAQVAWREPPVTAPPSLPPSSSEVSRDVGGKSAAAGAFGGLRAGFALRGTKRKSARFKRQMLPAPGMTSWGEAEEASSNLG